MGRARPIAASCATWGGRWELDGRFDVDMPAPNRVWKLLTGQQRKFGDTGGVVAAGSLRGSLAQPQVDGSFSAYGGRVTLAGGLAFQPLTFDLSFDAEHPSMPDLLAAMGQSIELNPSLGAVILTGQLVGDGAGFRLEELAGQLGATEFAGGLTFDTTPVRPYLEAELDVGPLAWPAIFHVEEPGGGKLIGAEGPQARDWSRAPLDLAWLEAFDGRLSLTSEALALIGFWLEEAALSAALQDGVLAVERLEGKLYGGAFAMSGQFAPLRKVSGESSGETAPDDEETSGEGTKAAKRQAALELQSSLSVTATDLDANQVLAALLDLKGVTGRLAIHGEFSGTGRSEAQLIAALSGDGRVEGTLSLALPDDGLGLTADAKRVAGVAEGATVVQDAFAGAPIALDGDFSLKRGSLRTQNLRLAGQGATAVTSGKVNLSDWQVSSQTDLYQDTAPDKAYLTAKLNGLLSAPDVTISGAPLRSENVAPDDDGQSQ